MTAAYTPLRCVWRAFCDQKGFPCSSGCRNMQNASKAINPFGVWSKQTSEWQVTHPPLENIKWNTTVELIHILRYCQKDASQTPPLFRLRFKVSSDECDANRCSDRIESMFDVGTFCHFSHTDGWSQTSAPNRLSLHRETMFALYCPAAFKNILIILHCKVRKTF